MGRFVNPDNSAFQVALNSEIYVDKTGLLSYTNKVLDTIQGYICNSRPRRFGKSFAANMLAAYYSKGCDSRKMFSGLAISQTADFEKHLNQYDVIHLDIQWFLSNVSDPEQIVAHSKGPFSRKHHSRKNPRRVAAQNVSILAGTVLS